MPLQTEVFLARAPTAIIAMLATYNTAVTESITAVPSNSQSPLPNRSNSTCYIAERVHAPIGGN